MKYEYEFVITADAGAALPSVGRLLKEVNDAVANGDPSMPQLKARLPLAVGKFSTERELTQEELETVKTTLQTDFQKAEPDFKFRVESIRRKSGNVQQSVAQ